MICVLKTFLRAVVAVFLIVSVIIIPQKMYYGLNTDKITDEMLRRRQKYYSGVINVWQIDCFEGGTGSRANWLKNITTGFERKNNGVFVNVEAVNVEMAEKLILTGQKLPDIISYGAGMNIDQALFIPLKLDNAPDLVESVTYPEAVPWCMGAYFMIGDADVSKWGTDGTVLKSKKGERTVYSVGYPQKYGHNALEALRRNSINSFGDEKALFKGTPQEIFEKYNYSYGVNRMIGTQRDLYRLKAAQSKEKARKSEVIYLKYSDLFQYVSILKCDDEKKIYAMNSFINYLLEEAQQSKLGTIGMFPVVSTATPEYDDIFVSSGWESIVKEGIQCTSFLFRGGEAAYNEKITLEILQKQ